MGRKTKIIEEAESWALSLWSKAWPRWAARSGQDKNYRSHVIHPAVSSVLRDLFPDDSVHILDLGCGDGVFLDDEAGKETLARGGSYTGIDISGDLIGKARSLHEGENIVFYKGNLADPRFIEKTLKKSGVHWNCALSVFTIQEIPDLRSFCENLGKIVPNPKYAILFTVHPDFAVWLRDNGRIIVEDTLELADENIEETASLPQWRWAGQYPIVDEPEETFYLPYFHRTVQDYRQAFTDAGLSVEKVIELPDKTSNLPGLVRRKISPFIESDANLYWPRIAKANSSLAFVLRKESSVPSKAGKVKTSKISVPPFKPGERTYLELRNRFMDIIRTYAGQAEIKKYTSPDRYDHNRVTYIIPPITSIEKRSEWTPGNLYIVKSGVVAIGRVFYTRTSGEFLVEELILRGGDIFGEFEVPLSILGSPALWGTKLPPRFNMTYGAWASGPALNWAMAYPRYIPRDRIVPGNPLAAVHPFFIKSKDIRPDTDAVIYSIPIEHFESMVSDNPDAMTWFLMNVLWKNRLYFEPPAQGYGRSSEDTIARLMIRILSYRIRLGLVVLGEDGKHTTCRTFIGPAEWLKHGLGSFAADLMEVVRSLGGSPREMLSLPVFGDELADYIDVTYHYPVKKLDDEMLLAMGCSPEEDRAENRYGLLTGIRIDLKNLDFFKNYLLERGE